MIIYNRNEKDKCIDEFLLSYRIFLLHFLLRLIALEERFAGMNKIIGREHYSKCSICICVAFNKYKDKFPLVMPNISPITMPGHLQFINWEKDEK